MGLLDFFRKNAEDPVKAASERQVESLEDMDFMYNRADVMLLEDGKITFIKTHDDEDSTRSEE